MMRREYAGVRRVAEPANAGRPFGGRVRPLRAERCFGRLPARVRGRGPVRDRETAVYLPVFLLP